MMRGIEATGASSPLTHSEYVDSSKTNFAAPIAAASADLGFAAGSFESSMRRVDQSIGRRLPDSTPDQSKISQLG